MDLEVKEKVLKDTLLHGVGFLAVKFRDGKFIYECLSHEELIDYTKFVEENKKDLEEMGNESI